MVKSHYYERLRFLIQGDGYAQAIADLGVRYGHAEEIIDEVRRLVSSEEEESGPYEVFEDPAMSTDTSLHRYALPVGTIAYMGDLEVTIIGVLFRANSYVQYEVAWTLTGDRKTAWVEVHELRSSFCLRARRVRMVSITEPKPQAGCRVVESLERAGGGSGWLSGLVVRDEAEEHGGTRVASPNATF